MASLKDFQKRLGFSASKRKTKDTEFDDITVVGGSEDAKSDPQRASRLQNIYTALKGSYEENRFRRKSKKQSIIAMFNRIANGLNEYESKTGEEIDNALFVVAVFKKYGEDTYPGHLLGKEAMNIYHEGLGQLSYVVASSKSSDEEITSDEKLLEHLCEVRGQSQAKVMAALENAGIFSPAFIKKWKGTRKIESEEEEGLKNSARGKCWG